MFLRPTQRAAAIHRANLSHIRLSSSSASNKSSTTLSNAVAAVRSRQQLARAVASPHVRSLATAVDTSNIYDPLASDSIMTGASAINLPQFDVQDFVVPSDPLRDAPASGRRRNENNNLPSDIVDLVAVFDACLHVNKLDRSALVLRKIGGIIANGGSIPGEQHIYMHNQFLRANIEMMRSTPSVRQAEAMHQWYELFIRTPGLPHTSETIAYMLRSAILSAKGMRLNRLVNRYMDMCPGELGLQVLGQTDILSAKDLAIITEICPRYNFSEATVEDTSPEEASPDIDFSEVKPVSESFPEVLATPQKGLGLKFLQKTLQFFVGMPENFDVSTLSEEKRREVQARMERESVDASINRWREEYQNLLKMGLNSSLGRPTMSSHMFSWHKALEKYLAEEIARYNKETRHTRDKAEENDTYSPLLLQADPARLAAVTLLSVLNTISILGFDRGAPLATVCSSVAKIAEEDINAYLQAKEQAALEKARRAGKVLRTVVETPEKAIEASGSKKKSSKSKSKSKAAAKKVETEEVGADKKDTETKYAPPRIVKGARPYTNWSLSMRTKVGAFLLSGVFKTAKITVETTDPETGKSIQEIQAAFTHGSQLRRGKKIGVIFIHPRIVDLMKSEPQGEILAKHLPMLIPPAPWKDYDRGAYLQHRNNIIRTKGNDPDQKLLAKAAVGRGDLKQISRGLDILGQTGWRINQAVLNVLMQAWNSGEAIADLPPLNPDIDIPAEPTDTSDVTARRFWLRSVKEAENERGGLHSNRCFINFQLEIARAFRNQTFYFPHNMDFRGRAYPLPTYLNHMGADHVRGILIFSKGRPLGERGLRWLKIHLANVAGYDKASLDEREAFAMEHLRDIFDSAENPLSGKRWWLEAEDAWQTLAACMELKAALDSPDPTAFISHLPVHQDGTCNGLQHYAALGGDMWGAKQVNLEPGERPADVYSAVASLVIEQVEEDCKHGNTFAKAVLGKITRKVVKQTVMTNVYGVTFQGAKKQVAKQLDAYHPTLEADTGYTSLILGSYVASKIFNAMGTMFRGAQEIQNWLGEVGGRICNSLSSEQVSAIATNPDDLLAAAGGSRRRTTFAEALTSQFSSTIVWTTPLRLPVSQPYRKSPTRAILTCLQDMVLADPDRGDPVDRRKQLQAFPPNFIHSLDASHMMLSALRCNEQNLEFAAVHDSFWTHAADVDVMNSVLRDSFIDIHKEDVIGRLRAEFEARYKGALYLARIEADSPAGKEINAWRKNTRSTLKDELQMEELRRQLIASTKPIDRRRAEKMVTPADIVAAHRNEGMLGPEGKEELAMANLDSRSTEDDEVTADSTETTNAEVQEEMRMHEDFKQKLKMSTFEMNLKNQKLPAKTKAKAPKKVLQVWLPLEFPAIPAKGDFNVERLRDSQYFFS